MNIYRDIRRRNIYGKNKREKKITFNSFLPFSICLGAIKKEIFKNLRFPETFGKNSAEDTFFQLDCHRRGKVFLYSPKIRGIHDHDLDYKAIFAKLFVELRGVGDLLYLNKRKTMLPFQYGFLSYPLFLMINLNLLLLFRFFLPFFVLTFFTEVAFAARCFKDGNEAISLRSRAFIYCLLGEIIKGYYLFYYLIRKSGFNFVILLKSFYQFLHWEKEKLRATFNLLFLNRQRRLKYAKI